jgi:hypothetical protein
MFQIAGGIILAIFLLHSMDRSYLSYIDWRERRADRKYFAGRVRRAEEAGWRWDPDSFSPYEEQLQRWEAEHTFERRAQRAREAGWRLRSNTLLTPEQQLRLWEWERKRVQGFRSQPAPPMMRKKFLRLSVWQWALMLGIIFALLIFLDNNT